MMRGVIGFAGLAAVSEAVTTVQMAVGKAGDLSVSDLSGPKAGNNSLCVVNEDSSITPVSAACVCGTNLKDGDAIEADDIEKAQTEGKGIYCYKDNHCIAKPGKKCHPKKRNNPLACSKHQWAHEEPNTLKCLCNLGENDKRPIIDKCSISKPWCYVSDRNNKIEGEHQETCNEFPKCKTHNDKTLAILHKDAKDYTFTKCLCNQQMCDSTNYCLGKHGNNDNDDGLCSANKYCEKSDDTALKTACATGFRTLNPAYINNENAKISAETCDATKYFYELAGSTVCVDKKKGNDCKCENGQGRKAGRSTSVTGNANFTYEVKDVVSNGCPDEKEECMYCNRGYVLDPSNKCVEKKCKKSAAVKELCSEEATGKDCKDTTKDGCKKCSGNNYKVERPDHLSNDYCLKPLCTCNNGEVDTKDCKSNAEDKCSNCNKGWTLKGNKCERAEKIKEQGSDCEKNSDCRSDDCELPKPIAAGAKDKKEKGKCVGADKVPECANGSYKNGKCNCHTGYTDIAGTCTIKTCACTNGDAFEGDDAVQCSTSLQCKKCHDGFYFADGKCEPNRCKCENGVAATGKDCKYDHANICDEKAKCTGGKYVMEKDVDAWLNTKTMNIKYKASYCKNNCANSGGGCSSTVGTPVNGEYPGLWTENNGECCSGAGTCSAASFAESGETFLKAGYNLKDAKTGKTAYHINNQLTSPTPIESCQSTTQQARSAAVLNSARKKDGLRCNQAGECKSGNCDSATNKCKAAATTAPAAAAPAAAAPAAAAPAPAAAAR